MCRVSFISFTLWGLVWLVFGCGEVIDGSLPERPTMDDVQAFVFGPACATAGCHTTQARAGDLDLSTSALSYEDVIEVAPSNASAAKQGLLRVLPGDPDSSFLFRKLFSVGPGEGTPMPTVEQRLTEPYLDLVSRWIEQGAVR